jgi:hypothetical protein
MRASLVHDALYQLMRNDKMIKLNQEPIEKRQIRSLKIYARLMVCQILKHRFIIKR